jgi:hypothetical protein
MFKTLRAATHSIADTAYIESPRLSLLTNLFSNFPPAMNYAVESTQTCLVRPTFTALSLKIPIQDQSAFAILVTNQS